MVRNMSIVKVPKVLMFVINIYDRQGKLMFKKGNNSVPKDIPLWKFINDDEAIDEMPSTYVLKGVLRTDGEGIYEATALRNGKWIKFKDEQMEESTEEDAMRAQMYPLIVLYGE
jgi:ubiquitin C-terminal hydrolase